MQLVDDAVAERKTFPAKIVPGKGIYVYDFGKRVYAFGLAKRGGIGQGRGGIVESKTVAGPRTHRERRPPVTGRVFFHEMKVFFRRSHDKVYFFSERCPNRELRFPAVVPGAGFW